MKVKDIMHTKVITIKPDTDIKEITKVLSENNISGVPVVSSEGELIGIVSEGDLLHKETNPRIPNAIGLLGTLVYYRGVKQFDSDFKKLIALQASEIMTKNVITTDKEADIEDVATLMVNKGIKRLPVVEDKKIIGIVSRIDIIRTLLRD